MCRVWHEEARNLLQYLWNHHLCAIASNRRLIYETATSMTSVQWQASEQPATELTALCCAYSTAVLA